VVVLLEVLIADPVVRVEEAGISRYANQVCMQLLTCILVCRNKHTTMKMKCKHSRMPGPRWQISYCIAKIG